MRVNKTRAMGEEREVFTEAVLACAREVCGTWKVGKGSVCLDDKVASEKEKYMGSTCREGVHLLGRCTRDSAKRSRERCSG